MIILYRSLWYADELAAAAAATAEAARDALVGATTPKLFLSADTLNAACVITGSRKIKKAIARKSKIAESNCA